MFAKLPYKSKTYTNESNSIATVSTTTRIDGNYSRADFGSNPAVNLAIGRLRYAFPDISIGHGNFQTSISHVYNSTVCGVLAQQNTGMGNGWKLNIQQYLFEDSTTKTVKYIDENGELHRFIRFDGDRYYEEYNAKTVLYYTDKEKYITDGIGNKWTFGTDGKLVSMVSNQNPLIEKIFVYDSNDRLISVYDKRTLSNGIAQSRIDLEYTANKLSAIKAFKRGKLISKLNYTYNGDKLVEVRRVADFDTDLSKAVLRFTYDENNLLASVVECDTKSAMQFKYAMSERAGWRVQKVASGVMKVTNQAEFVSMGAVTGLVDASTEPAVYSGNARCGGELSYEFVPKSYKEFEYIPEDYDIPYHIFVTNEKDIKLVYSISRDYRIINSFEISSRNGTLLTLEKQGAKRTGAFAAATQDEITQATNNEKEYFINGYKSQKSTNGELVLNHVVSSVDIARNVSEHKYRFFEYSFWLRLGSFPYSYKKDLFANVNFDNGSEFKARIDPEAECVWQRVSIPIEVPVDNKDNPFTNQLPTKIRLRIGDTYLDKCEFAVNEIGFTPAPKSTLKLDVGKGVYQTYDLVNDVILNGLLYTINHYNSDMFFTEDDIIATYTNKFAHQDDGKFDVICNNATKRLGGITSMKWYFSDGNESLETSNVPVQVCTSMLSGDVTILTNYEYTKNNFTVKNIALNSSDEKASSSQVTIDYHGKTVEEVDEYKITTSYCYDRYGNLIQTKVTGSDGTVGQIVDYKYDDECRLVSSTDGLTKQVTTYNDFDQPSTSTLQHNTADGKTIQDACHVENRYGPFRDKVVKVTEFDKDWKPLAQNNVTYQDGRIRTVTDGTVKYGVQYDSVNEVVNYTQFEAVTNAENKVSFKNEKPVQQDAIRKEAGGVEFHETISYSKNGGVEATVSTEIDKYGRTLQIKRHQDLGDEETVKTIYDTPKESLLVSKPIKTISNVEQIDYDYDDDGNLVAWRENRPTHETTFHIRKISDSMTKYQINKDTKRYAVVSYDDEALMSPRIKQTRYLCDYATNEDSPGTDHTFTQNYEYDSLGRLKSKSNDVFHVESYEYTKVGNTSQLTRLTYDGGENKVHYPGKHSDVMYEENVSYAGVDVAQITQSISWDDFTHSSDGVPRSVFHIKTYKYDDQHRITQEYNQKLGINCYYTYNKDGRLKSVTQNGTTTQYKYDNFGRLDQVGTDTTYSYDHQGNRIMRNKNGAITNYLYDCGRFVGTLGGCKYSYDSNGNRLAKRVNNKTTSFFYDGAKLLAERDMENGKNIYYFYDKDGIIGFSIDYDRYLFVKDTMGNVIMLIHSPSKHVYARYEYDMWGNCKVFTSENEEDTDPNSIGNFNPIRWKGFYFDKETGLYYANGSYYDPSTGTYLDAAPITNVVDNAYEVRSLDRNALMCNNVLELAGNPFTIADATELFPDGQYDFEAGTDWTKFKRWLGKAIATVTNWFNNLHWAVKLVVGIVFLACAIAITVATAGWAAAATVLIQVAIGVGAGVATWAATTWATGGKFTLQGFAMAALDSFVISSFFAFVSASANAIKIAYRKGKSRAWLKANAEKYLEGLKSELDVKSLERLKFVSATYDPYSNTFTYAYNSDITLAESTLHPDLQGLGVRTSCAETQAINKALNAGSKMKNLYVYTLNAKTGAEAYACRTCTRVFGNNVAKIFTGLYI